MTLKDCTAPALFDPIDITKDLSPRQILMIERLAKEIFQPGEPFSGYVKNRGVFFDRCLVADQQGADEMVFSDVIKGDLEKGGSFIGQIEKDLGPDGLKGALTLFQWLTTNIGKSVLAEALEGVNRKVVDIGEVVINADDIEFLEFTYGRLSKELGEEENLAYMRRLKRITRAARIASDKFASMKKGS